MARARARERHRSFAAAGGRREHAQCRGRSRHAVRRRARRGEGAAPDPKGLAALEPFAKSGVPSAAALARELTALMPALAKAVGTAPRESGILDRLKANAERIVRVRPIDEVDRRRSGGDRAAHRNAGGAGKSRRCAGRDRQAAGAGARARPRNGSPASKRATPRSRPAGGSPPTRWRRSESHHSRTTDDPRRHLSRDRRPARGRRGLARRPAGRRR